MTKDEEINTSFFSLSEIRESGAYHEGAQAVAAYMCVALREQTVGIYRFSLSPSFLVGDKPLKPLQGKGFHRIVTNLISW